MAPALEKPPADDNTSSGQTIGYLARISPEKGFHRLVDAFIQLKNMKGTEKACLKVAGWLGASNREYFNQQKARLDKAGYAGDFIFEENINRFAKMQFLSSLDVFSVPTTYREPKGRYILEAMAASIPVIQPNHGAFPDIIRNTGGGCLFDPEDQNEPAKSIHHLLTHDKERKDRGRRAREKVFSLYSAESMADSALSVYRQFIKNWTN
jgi:glycosyltransferase involved in cell wall biosynthesis